MDQSVSATATEVDKPPLEPNTNVMIIRGPKPEEQQRVLHLFRNCTLSPQTQFLLAVKERPVERFVGGIAGWTEGSFARFHLACLPGVAPESIAKQLIDHATETASAAGISKLLYAELLADTNPRSALLQANRFEVMRSERFFQIATEDAMARVRELLHKHADRIPAQWHTAPIRQHPPEVVLELIAPFRLLSPDEVRSQWAAGAFGGLDPDLSVILFDGTKPIGTVLTRRKGDRLYYDVRVVQHENPRLRALANLYIFKANVELYDPANPVRWLEFRGGETEHRETANLAFRMGGTELPPRHVWARAT
ncbi:MAG: hypothetical protein QM813_09070 [Verrucomicrobiota bacterium]